MKLSIVRGGGLAGVARETTLDDADLPPDAAAELREKVAAAHGLKEAGPASPSADAMLYEVKLSDGEEQTARFTDMSLPDPVRQLIEWVDGRPEQKTEFLPLGT